MFATITIGLDPNVHLGPLTLAWHGITIAIGLAVAALFARAWARHEKLDTEPLISLATWIALGGIVGARIFFLVEHNPGGLLSPSTLLHTRGFTFDGGVILGGIAAAVYVHGAPSNFFVAVRNAHPDALTPNSAIAYQNGGLYEVLLALLVFAIIYPLRYRFGAPLRLGWTVLGLFAVGRFAEFFLRADSPNLALGLDNAQWTSIVIAAVCAIGYALTYRSPRAH